MQVSSQHVHRQKSRKPMWQAWVTENYAWPIWLLLLWTNTKTLDTLKLDKEGWIAGNTEMLQRNNQKQKDVSAIPLEEPPGKAWGKQQIQGNRQDKRQIRTHVFKTGEVFIAQITQKLDLCSHHWSESLLRSTRIGKKFWGKIKRICCKRNTEAHWMIGLN